MLHLHVLVIAQLVITVDDFEDCWVAMWFMRGELVRQLTMDVHGGSAGLRVLGTISVDDGGAIVQLRSEAGM